MVNPTFALVSAVIWAVSPVYYRGFLEKFDFLSFNLFRTSASAVALLLPGLFYLGSPGLGYAALGGMVALACGDSLFLLSIQNMGASVAAPVVYTYVLMIQFVGVAIGQVIPYTNFASAVMVIAGVYLLSKGGGGGPRTKGIALAIAAGIAWTAGNELVQLATNAGANFVAVTFARDAAAALALGVAYLLTRKGRAWPARLPLRSYGLILAVVLGDLVIGSAAFVYSISTIGVALTVILTSLSPLLTQAFARALGKESPSTKDFMGGALIVAAVVVSVAF